MPCFSGPNCETQNPDPSCADEAFSAFSATTFNASRESYISQLKDHLLAQYDPHARPVTNLREPTVPVSIGIALLTVSDVNPVEGSWVASIWLRATWTDPYLAWDPADWGGVSELDFHPERGELWVPDISFYNQRENAVWSEKAAYVYSSGFIFYSRPAVVKMSCTQDLTKFPFDTQKCGFHIGTWNDHGHEIRFQPNGIDMSSGWTPNQEYKVEPIAIWSESKFYPCCNEPWPELFASVSLQRHPDFYIYNLIIPTICVTFLGTLQFYIPTSGASVDRMGLPAALLLTLIAITFLVSEDAPKTSEQTSLSNFNFGNLVWLTGSMLETSFVLFLSSLKSKIKVPVVRTLTDLLDADGRGIRSVPADLLSISIFTKGFKAFYMVYVEKLEARDDGKVTLEELGAVLDMILRVVYPVSYTIFVATIFG
jgi:hypothetical protein